MSAVAGSSTGRGGVAVKKPPAEPPKSSQFMYVPVPPRKDRKRKGVLRCGGFQEFCYRRAYVVPELKFTRGILDGPSPPVRPSSASAQPPPPKSVFSGLEPIKWDHVGGPIIIYGQPFSGKTTLFLKMFTNARILYGRRHWIQFVEMRQLAEIVRSLAKRPKSFLHLLAIQMKTTEKKLKDIFKPAPLFAKGKTKVYSTTGELFLDGFDEIPAKERDYFWRLIPQLKQKKGQSGVRVWISCRSYVKPTMVKVFPELGHFDIVKHTAHQQAEFLFRYWKSEYFPKLSDSKDKRLWVFTNSLYGELKALIPNFCDGLGCMPIVTEVIAGVFSPHASVFVDGSGDESQLHKILAKLPHGISVTSLMGKIVFNLIEAFCFKTVGHDNKYDHTLPDRVLPGIVRMYCDYALKTYPSYECRTTDQIAAITEQMHRVGFIIKDEDGIVRFYHKTLGDYFLGRFFAKANEVETEDVDLARFYLREMLFESEALGIFMYYDALIGEGDKNYRSLILHDFLIKHYKLGKGQEEEWLQLRDQGNIWHLCIIQGFHNTARRLLKTFKPEEERNELRKFLSMRAPIEMMEKNNVRIVDGKVENVRNRYIVTSLSVLALFGYGVVVEETLALFLYNFQSDEIQCEFDRQGQWSPVHFAAIHCNLWFIRGIYGPDFRKAITIQPETYNPAGLLPTHLLLTNTWHHGMRIMDCNLSDFDELPISIKKGLVETPTTSSNISSSTLDQTTCENSEERITTKDNTDQFGKVNGRDADEGCAGAGGHDEKNNKGESGSPGDAPIVDQNNYRFVIRTRDMYKDIKDWNGVVGLLEVLNACLVTFIEVGGEDPNAFDKNMEQTAMHRAAQFGLRSTSLILNHLGADLDLQNAQGITPVHTAALLGFKDLFLDLVTKGADHSLKDYKDRSAYMLWKEFGEGRYFSTKGRPQLSEQERNLLTVIEEADIANNNKIANEALEEEPTNFRDEVNAAIDRVVVEYGGEIDIDNAESEEEYENASDVDSQEGTTGSTDDESRIIDIEIEEGAIAEEEEPIGEDEEGVEEDDDEWEEAELEEEEAEEEHSPEEILKE